MHGERQPNEGGSSPSDAGDPVPSDVGDQGVPVKIGSCKGCGKYPRARYGWRGYCEWCQKKVQVAVDRDHELRVESGDRDGG